MSTFLFDKIIFGPVRSRRLGVSLGVNLLPIDSKVCSFNCIYCECGWNPEKREKKVVLPTREEVKKLLKHKLLEMKAEGELPDVITFAGNGEPTLHPDFEAIIDDTVQLRDQLDPNGKIAVLSNSTMLNKASVVNALKKVDDNILKLDSAIPETVNIIDCPVGRFSLAETIENLKKFKGQLIIQTLFLRGNFRGQAVDNTTTKEIDALIKAIKEIRPRQVMIYTIARDTPAENLEKVSSKDLKRIGTQIEDESGIPVRITYNME